MNVPEWWTDGDGSPADYWRAYYAGFWALLFGDRYAPPRERSGWRWGSEPVFGLRVPLTCAYQEGWDEANDGTGGRLAPQRVIA